MREGDRTGYRRFKRRRNMEDKCRIDLFGVKPCVLWAGPPSTGTERAGLRLGGWKKALPQ